MVEDKKLWNVVCNSPYMKMEVITEDKTSRCTLTSRKDYNEGDRRKIENNYKANKNCIYGIGQYKYTWVSACE